MSGKTHRSSVPVVKCTSLVAIAAAFLTFTAAAQSTGEASCAASFTSGGVQAWHGQTPCLEAKVREQAELPQDPTLFQNGQGFYVGDGTYILTAAHVLAGCQYFAVTDGHGRERSAGLVMWDARRDIGILRPLHGGSFGRPNRGNGLSLATLRRGAPVGQVNIATLDLVGTTVTPPRLTPRNASAPDAVPLGPDNSMVLEGSPLSLGASGAPVLNNVGEVVGMVTANIQLNSSTGESNTYTIATPSSELSNTLFFAGGDNRVRPPTTAVGPPSGRGDLASNLVKVRCR